MNKYTCPSLGDCDLASKGKIFETADAAPTCTECESLLVKLPGSEAAPGIKRKPLIAAGVAAVLVAAAGVGFMVLKPPARTVAAAVPSPSAPAAPVAQVASRADAVATPGMAPSEAETLALRRAGDAKLTQGDASGAELAGNKAAANEALKVAIAKMAQGRLDDAEKDLADAIARDPKQPLVYYDMAILRMKQGRTDEAMKEFEASFMAGFSHFDKMDQDTDLNAVRSDPKFVALMAQYRPKTP